MEHTRTTRLRTYKHPFDIEYELEAEEVWRCQCNYYNGSGIKSLSEELHVRWAF